MDMNRRFRDIRTSQYKRNTQKMNEIVEREEEVYEDVGNSLKDFPLTNSSLISKKLRLSAS